METQRSRLKRRTTLSFVSCLLLLTVWTRAQTVDFEADPADVRPELLQVPRWR